jgi:hypothetical protein
MDYVKSRIKELSTWNGIILATAAVLKWFMPDNVDNIIDMVVPILVAVNIAAPEKK